PDQAEPDCLRLRAMHEKEMLQAGTSPARLRAAQQQCPKRLANRVLANQEFVNRTSVNRMLVTRMFARLECRHPIRLIPRRWKVRVLSASLQGGLLCSLRRRTLWRR